jgi:two-component system nitrate/nitrite response regulator NarL
MVNATINREIGTSPMAPDGVQAGSTTMQRQHILAAVLVGKSIFREGLAKILRSANFRILASVSCADDLHPNRPNQHPPLFLIVHTGDDFDAALNKSSSSETGTRTDALRSSPITQLNELVSAFRAGANGYSSTSSPATDSSNPWSW